MIYVIVGKGVQSGPVIGPTGSCALAAGPTVPYLAAEILSGVYLLYYSLFLELVEFPLVGWEAALEEGFCVLLRTFPVLFGVKTVGGTLKRSNRESEAGWWHIGKELALHS